MMRRTPNQTLASSGPALLGSTYPYRAVGKLVFTVNGQSSWCAASLIRRSIIVTAAHCIQDFGSGASTFPGWVFRPGHYGATGATSAQIAPYGAFWLESRNLIVVLGGRHKHGQWRCPE